MTFESHFLGISRLIINRAVEL